QRRGVRTTRLRRTLQSSLVRTLSDRSQVFRPALQPFHAQNAAASTASRAASVTIAIRPLCGRDGQSSRDDLGWMKTEIFLQSGLDTKLPDGQISKYVGWLEPREIHYLHEMQLMGVASASPCELRRTS